MYDVMSAYPVIGNDPYRWVMQDIKPAMALLGKNRADPMHNIERRHFNSTAKQAGYGRNAEALIRGLIERTPTVVEQVQRDLPKGFPQIVADALPGGLLKAAQTLEAMPAV